MVLAALLSACGADTEPTTQAAAPTTAPSAQTEASADSAEPPVRQRAEAALRAQRLFAPAGDNAFELFLQVLADTPDDAFARDALQDLFPYAVLQVDQRLAAGDRAEATRLLELLRRAQPEAPALPRLQRSLDALSSSAPVASNVVTASSAAAVAAPAQPEAPTVTTETTPPATPVSEPLQPQATSPAPVATEPSAAPASESVNPPVTAPTTPAETAAAPASSATSTALPRLLRQTAPRYPTVAGRRKLEGLVELAFTIAPNGRVVDIQVLRSEPPGVFDRAAVAAIEDWRYEAPAQNVRTSRTFEFKLD